MRPVTDPALLAQLNADSGKPVTDPAILAQLNGSSSPNVGLGTAFGVASELAPWNIARGLTTEPLGEKVAEVGGSLGYPKTGATLGTAIQTAPDILGMVSPANTEAAILRGPAESFGRRALGFTKGMIKRGGGVEKVNQVAGQMLDEGVITAGASPATMLEKAQDVSQASGQRIGETLKDLNQPATTAGTLKREIASQLSPGRRGGQYDKIRGTTNEILKTVGAHGKGPISFESAQELKQTLKGPAQFGKLTDGERAEMYRRSYGIVRESIDKGLDKAVTDGLIPAEKAAQFLRDKATYGASEQAVNALKDKLAGEAANNIVSLRGAFAGGVGLATGDISKTIGGIGGWEVLRRRGDATAAGVLNSLSKTRGVNTFRGAVLPEAVNPTDRRALITQFVNQRSKGSQ